MAPLVVLLAAMTRTPVTMPLFIMMVTFSPALRLDNLVGAAPIMILADDGIITVLLMPLLFMAGLTVSECAVIDVTVPVICVIMPLDDILEDDIFVPLILLPDIFVAVVLAIAGSNALLKMPAISKPDAMRP